VRTTQHVANIYQHGLCIRSKIATRNIHMRLAQTGNCCDQTHTHSIVLPNDVVIKHEEATAMLLFGICMTGKRLNAPLLKAHSYFR
jgi:hypothetical protein